jgi:hypothetical protein
MRLLPLLLAIVVMAGCPDKQYRFTNADVAGNGWRGGDLLAAAPGALEDVAGSGVVDVPREVVEPDVIRRVNNMLYVLNQYRGLTIVDLDKEEILAQVPTFGYPRDLYVVGNRAYVLVASASQYKTDGPTVSFTVASRLYVVDLDNPSDPDLPQFDLNGDLVDSRLVGNVLYAVCAEYQYSYDGGVVPVAVIKAATSASWVTSVNVAAPSDIRKVDEVPFEGLGSVIQATNSAIFVAAPSWDTNQTTITYVDISDPAGDIEVAGSIAVQGYLGDKFKMDAYQGVLRVVSNDWNWGTGRKNFITTISLADPMKLEQLGETELTDASGETLFATRFDGPRAYVVTYLTKDPLFVIDLSDPTKPKVAGTLVVPGWSTYIEPRGDRLIALGVDDTNGGRKVCVSLFDVSNPENPQQVGEKATFGEDWSWSSAYSDVKAFTVLDNVLIVPFSGWTNERGGYERLQFISYSPAGLATRGFVDLKGSVLRSFEYGDRYYGVTTEQLATIDGANLDSPVVEKTLALAEYVSNIVELSPEVHAEVITQSTTGKTLVRTIDAADSLLDEVELDIGGLSEVRGYGSSVVAVGTDWNQVDYKTYYLVEVVDCSNPGTLVPKPVIKVDVQPFWGGWWYRGGGIMLMDAVPPVALGAPGEGSVTGGAVATGGVAVSSVSTTGAGKMVYAPWWPWWTPQDNTFLLGDILVLRCSADTYDVTLGDQTPYQGVALVDLAANQWTKTVGLGFNQIVSMNEAGAKLYIGTQDPAGYDFFQPVTANYLRALDIGALTMGPAVNVPGTFVQYQTGRSLLVVRDDQWDTGWQLTSTLRSLSWDGSETVQPLDQVALPTGVGTILGRGANIFVDTQSWQYGPVALADVVRIAGAKDEPGYYLYAVHVGDNGVFALSDAVLVTKQWGSLFDAHGTKAYVTVGNALAIYDFADAPSLVDLYETMGYPVSMCFGAEYAYASFGYAGVAKLPL